MSKTKDIGTRAETAVRNFLLSKGYSELEAHRNVLKGSADEGDVWLRHHRGLVTFEVKGGKAAKEASYGQIEKWLEETRIEKENAKAQFGILVTQRAGVGYPRAGEWWAYVKLPELIRLHSYSDLARHSAIVRVLLKDVVEMLDA